MKKIFAFFAILGLLLALPFKAFAAIAPDIPSEPESEKTNSDGTVTKYYNVYVKPDNNEPITTVEFEFAYKSAITNFECKDADPFKASQENTGEGKATCTFTIPNDGQETGTQILVGKLAVTVNKNAAEKDCEISYSLNGASTTLKFNPQTGGSVPYAIIIGGVALSIGVYFATKKRTKLYKI